jgi:hypothetical protein
MAGGAETPNIAALPAIARLGTCESARGPDADRHVKLLIQFAVEGSLSGAYSQQGDPNDESGYGTFRTRALKLTIEVAQQGRCVGIDRPERWIPSGRSLGSSSAIEVVLCGY